MLHVQESATSSGRASPTTDSSPRCSRRPSAAPQIKAVRATPEAEGPGDRRAVAQGRQRKDDAHDEHLSMATRRQQQRTDRVVDLDCVFGDVASVMGLVPEHTIGELAVMPSFDSTTLKVYLSRHERSGLYVLAGSGRPRKARPSPTMSPLECSNSWHVTSRTSSSTPRPASTSAHFVAIEHATDIVLLASMDVASVRNLGKEVDALNRLGFTGATPSLRPQSCRYQGRARGRRCRGRSRHEGRIGHPEFAATCRCR